VTDEAEGRGVTQPAPSPALADVLLPGSAPGAGGAQGPGWAVAPGAAALAASPLRRLGQAAAAVGAGAGEAMGDGAEAVDGATASLVTSLERAVAERSPPQPLRPPPPPPVRASATTTGSAAGEREVQGALDARLSESSGSSDF
jgi:hypothetical protein